jgi:hypothetical protein
MQSQILFALDIARERQQQAIEQASIDRQLAANGPQRPSMRRSVGRRVIALGQRIAAEPSLELARSR